MGSKAAHTIYLFEVNKVVLWGELKISPFILHLFFFFVFLSLIVSCHLYTGHFIDSGGKRPNKLMNNQHMPQINFRKFLQGHHYCSYLVWQSISIFHR